MLAILATLILTPFLVALLYRLTLGEPARARVDTEQGKNR